ncbi:MAG: glycine cleavage system aminomethyltransferase GcvT [bacterium]|nr:glycine cleavage system aminomethyltransferase GcvT [bacterium]
MSQDKNFLHSPVDAFHRTHGARMTEFAGWEMPLQFSGIVDEHLAVRHAAGLFDITHMGQIEVTGESAFDDLQRIVTKDLSKVEASRAVYSLLCNEEGGILDDIIVYKRGESRFLIIVNGVNAVKDYEWLRKNCVKATKVHNLTTKRSLFAVQGPKSAAIVSRLVSEPLAGLYYFHFREDTMLGLPVILARTGYTGEDGFEVSVDAEDALDLWNSLLEAGTPLGMKLTGLGARDTLRLEMAYPLYGMEISEQVSPFEANLDKAVSLKKGDFIGREAILRRRDESSRTLVGLEMLEMAVPRHGFLVKSCDSVVGRITSGTMSPSLGRGIALALVRKDHSEVGTILDVEIREKRRSAIIVRTPFWNPRVYLRSAVAPGR